eukprot:6206827-Pleurochrysis_carterae.AAC.1
MQRSKAKTFARDAVFIHVRLNMKTIDAVQPLINRPRHLVPARVLLAGPTLFRAREQQTNAPSSSAQRSGTRRAAG